jgi:hypothetical protein
MQTYGPLLSSALRTCQAGKQQWRLMLCYDLALDAAQRMQAVLMAFCCVTAVLAQLVAGQQDPTDASLLR